MGGATGGVRSSGGASGGDRATGGAAGAPAGGNANGQAGLIDTSSGGTAGDGAGGYFIPVAGTAGDEQQDGTGGAALAAGGSAGVTDIGSSGGGAGGVRPEVLGGAAGSAEPTDATGGASSQGGQSGHAGVAGGPAQDAGAAGSSGAGGAPGVAGAGGSAGSGSEMAQCGAPRDAVVFWSSFEGTLDSRVDGASSLVTVPDIGAAQFASGVAAGQALDVDAGPFVELSDAALDIADALTLSAFVRSASPNGRILDRISAGGVDGYLLDILDGRPRLIVGSRWLQSAEPLPVSSGFVHVAAVFTGASSPEIRLYVNGELTDSAAVDTGPIPSNSLTLRVGADRDGNNRFSGQIDEPMVFSRALDDQEVATLYSSLSADRCPDPVATCPRSGLLLRHDESGHVAQGAVECLGRVIHRSGDVRVLVDGLLTTCQWPMTTTSPLASCQVSFPFATEDIGGSYFSPVTPLEWRWLKLNTTGYTDQIGYRIESHTSTVHEQASFALSWFGEDWRVQSYAVDATGTITAGSLVGLSDELHAGAGVGVSLPDWSHSLPHLTALFPLASGGWAGLDPWHISTETTGLGESCFQSDAYHYGMWVDTNAHYYASRWYVGSPASISDSSAYAEMGFWTEPGWSEVFAHNAAGSTTTGALAALVLAAQSGAAIRIGAPDGYFDCGTVASTGTEVTCLVRDAFEPVDDGAASVRFDGNHARSLRYYTTSGRALREGWADHTGTLLSSTDEQAALRWFALPADWTVALETDSDGAVASGSTAALLAAVETGAEVMVARDLGEATERVVCDSLRIDTDDGRVACLRLDQVPTAITQAMVPGHYEARVYNTNGVVAGAQVPFGSTTSSALDTPIVALRWFVRTP